MRGPRSTLPCRRVLRQFLGIAAGLLALTAPARAQDSFDEESILELTGAGVGTAAIVATIDTLPCNYAVSVAEIARLKKAGVANPVIAAMIRRCAEAGPDQETGATLRTGIYLLPFGAETDQAIAIVPALVAAGRSGGNGSILFPYKSRLTLNGAHASVISLSRTPSFLIVIDHRGDLTAGAGRDAMPAELARLKLARFNIKSGNRVLVVDTLSPLGSQVGVDREDVVATRVSPLSQTNFRLEVLSPLDPGEYALVREAAGNSYAVFDFQVP